jgi:hypothetical protein
MTTITITYSCDFIKNDVHFDVETSYDISVSDCNADYLVKYGLDSAEGMIKSIEDILTSAEFLRDRYYIKGSIKDISYADNNNPDNDSSSNQVSEDVSCCDNGNSDLVVKNDELKTELTQYRATFADIQDTLNEFYNEFESSTFTSSECTILLASYLSRINKLVNG